MKSAVVFESLFGNTGEIAAAIADGLAVHGEVSTGPPSEMPTDVDLIVFGAPTHAHGLPTRMSRVGIEREVQQRQEAGEEVKYYPTPEMRMLIDDLPKVDGKFAATFDTRFEASPVLTGSAARKMAKKLNRLGYRVVVPAESFFVLDTEGPLKEGELARARAWGETVGALAKVPA